MSSSAESIKRSLHRSPSPAGPLLPPLVRVKGRTAKVLTYPGGKRGMSIVRDAFSQPRYGPWRDSLQRIASFARSRPAWRRLITARNGGLHGDTLRITFSICTLADPVRARRVTGLLVRKHLAALGLLLRRLERDFGSGSRIKSIEMQPGDRHRGGQTVAKVVFRDGRALAYKPRPVDAEGALFGAGWGSVAELANGLLESRGLKARLPLLEIRRGSGPDRRHYGYMGWIDARPWLRPLRRRGLTVRAARVDGPLAAGLWEDAGLLSAFAYGLGIVDLHHDNLVVGRGPTGRLMYHPIDSEFVGARTPDLEGTLLVKGSIRHGARGHAHAGFESEVLLCGRESDSWGFVRRRRRWSLDRLHGGIPDCHGALVVDRLGRPGYRRRLGEFLSGLVSGFDLLDGQWALFSRCLRRGLKDARLRYLARSTQDYGKEIMRRMLGWPAKGTARFRPSELRQLDRLDVPYYFQKGRGPIMYYERYPRAQRRSGPLPRRPEWRVGCLRPGLRRGAFAGLLQDALDHVIDAGSPLRIDHGGIRVLRSKGSAVTRFEGRVGGRLWIARIDCRKGTAEVSVR